jgi:hypothetical protein
MPNLTIAPAPRENPVVRAPEKQGDPNAFLPTEIWGKFIDDWIATSNRKPTLAFDAKKTDQQASIAATDFTGGLLAAGLYRLQYYARVTQAASTSSSLQVQISWTDGSVAQSKTFSAVTGNTTSTTDIQTMLIRVDEGSPVRYEVTYASVGATPMKFALYVTLEHVKAL